MTRENKAKQVREGEYERNERTGAPPPLSIGEEGQGKGRDIRHKGLRQMNVSLL